MNIEAKMHSQFIEKKLKGLSGFSFEEHARFFLKLISIYQATCGWWYRWIYKDERGSEK